MTVRELAAKLTALPEELQDLPVFSTADWTEVTEVGSAESGLFDDYRCVEIG